MDHKTFHGNITPKDISKALIAHFHRGNYRVQQIGEGDNVIVQIASVRYATSGGQTSVGISIQKFEDGIMVQIGKQSWMGIAASLGKTALTAIRNPLSILGRIDDIAQDFESLSIRDEIWSIINQAANNLGASHELSTRLRKYICNYCDTPNPIGEAHCIACGAPLGGIQPQTCSNCGYIITNDENFCPNCKQKIFR
ncbi:MAG TPA: zinc ribbon domain-containing protein [Anaerolineaceae bacterium]|nr:zinc ribbon domain-containing protein [Anaerolineaceae bacterium]